MQRNQITGPNICVFNLHSSFHIIFSNNIRPPTGKVTNVLLDNSDIDEDDNFVVREAAVAQGPGLGGVDETPVTLNYQLLKITKY